MSQLYFYLSTHLPKKFPVSFIAVFCIYQLLSPHICSPFLTSVVTSLDSVVILKSRNGLTVVIGLSICSPCCHQNCHLNHIFGHIMVLIMLKQYQVPLKFLNLEGKIYLELTTATLPHFSVNYLGLFNIYLVSLLKCTLQSERPSSISFYQPFSVDTEDYPSPPIQFKWHTQGKYFFLYVHIVLYVFLSEQWYRYVDWQVLNRCSCWLIIKSEVIDLFVTPS